MGNITYIRKGKFIKSMKNPRRRLAGVPTWGYYKYYLLHGTSIETEIEKSR